MNASPLRPHRHAPPPGWSAETFEAVTDSLAAALVASMRRYREARVPLMRTSVRVAEPGGGNGAGR